MSSEMTISPTDINEIVNDLALLCESEFHLQSILKVDKSPIEILVNVDKSLIMQAAINVIRNAKQAVETAENPEIRITSYQKMSNAYIEISDNGVGIDREDIENIFIPFFTTKPNGSGIGLTIAKQLITIQGGRIDIHSEKNRGTTLTIILEMMSNNTQTPSSA
ncbi:MAG: ATP-binding protein [Candidatus Staskawiczbacteria bacterium]